MRLIEDWQNNNLRCFFCGMDKSVKYTVHIDKVPYIVYACNRCALIHAIDEEHDEKEDFIN